jgi:hypothetical protein
LYRNTPSRTFIILWQPTTYSYFIYIIIHQNTHICCVTSPLGTLSLLLHTQREESREHSDSSIILSLLCVRSLLVGVHSSTVCTVQAALCLSLFGILYTAEQRVRSTHHIAQRFFYYCMEVHPKLRNVKTPLHKMK